MIAHKEGAVMDRIVLRKAKNSRGGKNRDPVGLTALVYLRDALLREEYEICGFIIQTAKEFGVSDLEILNVLEDPKRSVA